MDNARVILDDLRTDQFKQKLLTLPGQIEAQKTKIRQLREVFTEKEQARALREAEIMDEINIAINPNTGKPLYSNEKAREAAKLRKMSTDPEYQQLTQLVKEAEMAVNAAQDELERLYDEFKATQFITQLIGYEVALFANTLEPGRKLHPVTELKKAQAY
jgi:transcription initiation factor IIF auxiliary subunit